MARTSAAGRRTCFLIIVLLLLAAVLMGYQYLFPKARRLMFLWTEKRLLPFH